MILPRTSPSVSHTPTDDAAPRLRPAPPPRRPRWKAVALGAAVAVLAMGVGSGGVYVWHRAQARDQAARLGAAEARLDAAKRQVDASAATITTLTHRVDALTSRVDRLRASLASAAAPTAACDPRAMLPVIQGQVDISPPLAWGSVTIEACQNGFARVLAMVSNPPPNFEQSELVYLQDVDGGWRVIASGTGLMCSDPEVAEACQALRLT